MTARVYVYVPVTERNKRLIRDSKLEFPLYYNPFGSSIPHQIRNDPEVDARAQSNCYAMKDDLYDWLDDEGYEYYVHFDWKLKYDEDLGEVNDIEIKLRFVEPSAAFHYKLTRFYVEGPEA
jgi:hypothetical protein